jgi:hypothetical protein
MYSSLVLEMFAVSREADLIRQAFMSDWTRYIETPNEEGVNNIAVRGVRSH